MYLAGLPIPVVGRNITRPLRPILSINTELTIAVERCCRYDQLLLVTF